MFNAVEARRGAISSLAVEVKVSWGDQVLLVRELLPGQGFCVGNASAGKSVDFALSSDALGCETFALISWANAEPVLQLPQAAEGQADFETSGMHVLGELRAALAPYGENHLLPLPRNSGVCFNWAGLSFELSCQAPQSKWARSVGGSEFKSLAGYFGASLVSTAAVLAGMAFFVPPMGLNDGERIDADRIYLLQQYLDSAAERELEQQIQPAAEAEQNNGGSPGAQASGAEGALDKPEAAKTGGKLAIKGPAQVSEVSLRQEAEGFGMIGLLASGTQSDGLTAPWARDSALGADPLNAMGGMWGDELKDSFGSGGLGLMGSDEGGGGRYQGIGLGQIGTIGSMGTCEGAGCSGFGAGHGRVPGSHSVRSPRVRVAPPQISGRLPPQAIQRIVRQNFGRFRQCYDTGLQANPNLEGRVTVRFLIDRAGVVSNASNGGSSLPNSEVVSCVVRAFYGLSFPKPEVGSVQVSYPIMFSPQ